MSRGNLMIHFELLEHLIDFLINHAQIHLHAGCTYLELQQCRHAYARAMVDR